MGSPSPSVHIPNLIVIQNGRTLAISEIDELGDLLQGQVLPQPSLDLLRMCRCSLRPLWTCVCAGAPSAFSGPPAFVQALFGLLWISCYCAGASTALAPIDIVSLSSDVTVGVRAGK